VLASAYDINRTQFGNVAGDLTLEPSRMLRFHGDASYNVVGEGLQAYTTDVTLIVPRVTASVGTRFTRTPPVIVPYFVQTPGTFNPGNNLPSNQSTHFLQGAASVELWRNLVAHAKTNWDIRTTRALEQELAAVCGVPWALGVASGTDALHLALTALGVGPGDEVITPAFSFVASASTIVMAGATPVFVDIDPATYTLDPAATERAVTPRTRAIMPVHLYGLPAPMDRVLELARAHRVAVIEDAAQGVGGAVAERPVGAFGH